MPLKAFPDLIKRLRLFSGIPEDEISSLLKEGNLLYLKRGEYLFHQGDKITKFYIVCRGSIRLIKETPEGKEITTEVAISGKSIGKSDILTSSQTIHRISACAMSDATVLEFPNSWLKQIALIPTVALNIISTLSEYAHIIEIEAEQKQTMNATQRVGCFLQRLCAIHELDPTGFTLPYSKSIIASRLGLEPETFSRTLIKLEEYGIEVKNNFVSFTSISSIERLICHHCSMHENCSSHQQAIEKLTDNVQD